MDSDIIRELEVLAPLIERNNSHRYEDGLPRNDDNDMKPEFTTLPSRSRSLDNLPVLSLSDDKDTFTTPSRTTWTSPLDSGNILSLDLISLGTPVAEEGATLGMHRYSSAFTPIQSLPSGLSGYGSQVEDADEGEEDKVWKV